MIYGTKHINNRYIHLYHLQKKKEKKKQKKPASVKLNVVIADRHGEFTIHPPSPPVCLVVICRGVKRKKIFLKKYPTFFPCRSQPKDKTPGILTVFFNLIYNFTRESLFLNFNI